MTDGAHLNIDANSAMQKIVGGGDDPEPMADAEFEQMIREAPLLPPEEMDYSGGANAAARIVLEAYEKYPQLRELADESMYLQNGEDGGIDWQNPIVLNVTLYEVIKKVRPEHQAIYDHLTGFMWGWAVNAARNILGLGPLPNPALLTISIPDENLG